VTTPYHIRIAPMAQRQIALLAIKHQRALIRLIEALAINPRPQGAIKVEGMTGLYSESINHFRIIYKVEDQEVLVLIIK
jgi:mRNA interferase RelE/StbE